MNSGTLTQRRTGLFASILGATVVVFTILTLIAGLPSDGTSGFVVGLLVLFAVTTGIGIVGWHLMLRPLPGPLPAGERAASHTLSEPRERHLVALLLSLATVSFGLAGVWDEVWHTKYGVPFGLDFFWRPHLMLYFAFTCVIGVGLWGWWVMMRRGRGTLQQRFRAEPILGMTVLLAAYTVYAVSADPVWHWMYGEDLAPWSVPHLLLLLVILLVALLAIGYHRSVMAGRAWSSRVELAWRDVLIGLVVAGAMLAFLLIFTVEWYAASTSPELMAQILGYPDWLLTAFVTFLATMFGTVALHATRRVGSATLVGLLTLGLRFLFDTALDGERAGTVPLWLMLPVLMGLDVWYGVSVRRTGRAPSVWTAAGVTALLSCVVGLPLTGALFDHPPVTAATVPGMVIAGALAAAGGVGLGRVLGETSQGEPESTRSSSPRVATNLVYVAYVLFLVVFVATAVPPAG